ncbi:MAG TPA: uroporphyrinogen decarboxylase family protein [Clostridia bacterium]|nr:uroporphyrinogen decarboxylase family protein [Clostridia bacterium]
MNPRERVLCSLNHEKPDRVPIDLGGVVTSFTDSAYGNLVTHLGISEPSALLGGYNLRIDIDEDILRHFGVDTRHVYTNPLEGWETTYFEDGSFDSEIGIHYKIVGDYSEMVYHPFADLGIDELREIRFPDMKHPSRYKGMREKCEKIKADGFAVVSGSLASVFELSMYTRGMSNFLMDLIVDKDFANLLTNKIVDMQLDYYKGLLDEVGDSFDVVCMADDLGTQTAPMLSLPLFREMIKPKLEKIYKYIRSRTSAFIFHHTCGASYDFIGDLIDIGMDILNPVQPGAAGMDMAKIKKNFGKRISFWGGMDIQQVLPHGTPEQIKSNVHMAIDTLGKGGGLILAPAHNIQGDVPPANLELMCREAMEYSRG